MKTIVVLSLVNHTILQLNPWIPGDIIELFRICVSMPPMGLRCFGYYLFVDSEKHKRVQHLARKYSSGIWGKAPWPHLAITTVQGGYGGFLPIARPEYFLCTHITIFWWRNYYLWYTGNSNWQITTLLATKRISSLCEMHLLWKIIHWLVVQKYCGRKTHHPYHLLLGGKTQNAICMNQWLV